MASVLRACRRTSGRARRVSLAKIELAADGRIALYHSAAEIGTGMSTSQAFACAKWLGKPASDVHTSVTEWPDLPVVTSGDPYIMSQAEQDRVVERIRAGRRLMCRLRVRRIPRSTSRIDARSRARRLCARALAGGEVDLEPRDRRRADGAARRTDRGCALGRRQALRRGSRAAAARTVREGRRMNSGSLPVRPCTDSIAGNGARRNSRSPARWSAFRSTGWRCAMAKARMPRRPRASSVLDRKRVFIPPVARNNADVTYYSAVGTLVELAVTRAVARWNCFRIIRSSSAAT